MFSRNRISQVIQRFEGHCGQRIHGFSALSIRPDNGEKLRLGPQEAVRVPGKGGSPGAAPGLVVRHRQPAAGVIRGLQLPDNHVVFDKNIGEMKLSGQSLFLPKELRKNENGIRFVEAHQHDIKTILNHYH